MSDSAPTEKQLSRPPLATHRWGHVTLVRNYRKPIMLANSLTGELYVADSNGPWVLVLRCDCGQEWEVEEKLFLGRRKVRSCDGESCPFRRQKRAPKALREPYAAVSVYLGATTVEAVRRFQEAHALRSFSKAIEALVREYQVMKLLNED